MNNPFEHQISESTIWLAQKHNKKIIKHGQFLETIGNKLQSSSNSKIKVHRSIEKSGYVISRQANQAKVLLKKLQENHSTQIYTQLTINHVQATKNYIQATKNYISALKNFLDLARSNHDL